MKIVLVLAVCVVVALGERCRDRNDCTLEHCVGTGWTIDCHFGQCTCNNDAGGHTGQACSGASDCSGANCPGGFLSGHCVDGHCRCTFNSGVGK